MGYWCHVGQSLLDSWQSLLGFEKPLTVTVIAGLFGINWYFQGSWQTPLLILTSGWAIEQAQRDYLEERKLYHQYTQFWNGYRRIKPSYFFNYDF
jgi:hypothetical protein